MQVYSLQEIVTGFSSVVQKSHSQISALLQSSIECSSFVRFKFLSRHILQNSDVIPYFGVRFSCLTVFFFFFFFQILQQKWLASILTMAYITACEKKKGKQ